LFAAGSILAHQDWMRMKCGSGLALSTAYAAVNSAHAELQKHEPKAVRCLVPLNRFSHSLSTPRVDRAQRL
jgi:hypothetical protein